MAAEVPAGYQITNSSSDSLPIGQRRCDDGGMSDAGVVEGGELTLHNNSTDQGNGGV